MPTSPTEPSAAGTAPPATRRLWPLAAAAAVGAAIAGAAVAGLVGWTADRPPPARPVSRFSIQAPNLAARVIGTGSSVAMSPDGRTIVYVVGGAEPGLEKRRLNDLTGEPFAAPRAARRPFFSPDGACDRLLRRRQAQAGARRRRRRRVIADAPPNARGTWGDDGTIVLARPGLSRVPASGGALEEILEASERDRPVLRGRVPARRQGGARAEPPAAQRRHSSRPSSWPLAIRHPLVEGGSPKLAATGELLFVREGKIWAAKFDAPGWRSRARRCRSSNRSVLVDGDAGEGGFYATARDGSLVYLAGEASELAGVARPHGQGDGRPGPTNCRLRNPRLSPDGRRVVANGTIAGRSVAVRSRARVAAAAHDRRLQPRRRLVARWPADSRSSRAPATPQLGAGLTQDLFVVPAGGGAADPAARTARSAVGRFVVARRTVPGLRRRSRLLARSVGAALRRRAAAAGGHALQRAGRGDLDPTASRWRSSPTSRGATRCTSSRSPTRAPRSRSRPTAAASPCGHATAASCSTAKASG